MKKQACYGSVRDDHTGPRQKSPCARSSGRWNRKRVRMMAAGPVCEREIQTPKNRAWEELSLPLRTGGLRHRATARSSTLAPPGQMTSDVARLSTSRPTPGCLCLPRGQAILTFLPFFLWLQKCPNINDSVQSKRFNPLKKVCW